MSPPYIYKAADNSTRGLLVELLEAMLQKSCGQCVVYDTMNSTYSSSMLMQGKPREDADFTLPVIKGVEENDVLGQVKKISFSRKERFLLAVRISA